MNSYCHPSLDYLARLVRSQGPGIEDFLALDYHIGQLMLDTENDSALWQQWLLLRDAWFGHEPAEDSIIGSLVAHAQGQLPKAALIATVVSRQNLTEDLPAWDRYIMQQSLFQAYWHRQAVLQDRLETLLEEKEHVRIMHVGNGLGQDIRRVLDVVDPWRVTVVGLEADPVLRVEGRERHRQYAADWTFPEPDSWKKTTEGKMDLAWYPWCLDSMNDELFILSNQTVHSCMKQGAELIYCAATPDVSSQAVAKAFGEWSLPNRSRASLLHLIMQPSLAQHMQNLSCENREGEWAVRVTL